MLRISTLVLMLASALPAYAKERSASSQALKLSALGIMYYRDGDYVQAIARFREAYAKQRRPDLLYNIAQAYRKIGDCPQALDHYQRYLVAEPTAYNRVRIEERIYEMEQCTQGTIAPPPSEQLKKTDIEAPPVESAKPPPPVEPPLWPAEPEPEPAPFVKAPPKPMRGRGAVRVIGLVSIGAGLAMTAAAAGLTASAASTADVVGRLYREGGQWNDEFGEVDSRGRAASSAAAGLYTVGAAAIAGGGAMVWLGWRTPK